MNIKRLTQIRDGFRRGVEVNATLPDKRTVRGTYVEEYAPDKHTVKGNDGKLYGVSTSGIERIKNARKPYNTANRNAIFVERYESQINELRNELKDIELDMEEEISQSAQIAAKQNGTDYETELYLISSDGNNPIVVEYGNEIDRINEQIERLQNKIRQSR